MPLNNLLTDSIPIMAMLLGPLGNSGPPPMPGAAPGMPPVPQAPAPPPQVSDQDLQKVEALISLLQHRIAVQRKTNKVGAGTDGQVQYARAAAGGAEDWMMAVRPEFDEITSGWTLISGMEDISDRIERVGKWAETNGPLLPDEEARVKMMIKCQIARGIARGDFEPFISARCLHDRLDEDGICRRCGEDCRGIS